MSRQKLPILGIEGEFQLKGQKYFNKIIGENFSNQKKDMPKRLDQKTMSPSHIIIKTLYIQNKKWIWKAAKEKDQVKYKGRPFRITPNISMETLKVRRTWTDVLQTLRDHRCQPRLLFSVKLSSIIEEESKILINNYLQIRPYRRY